MTVDVQKTTEPETVTVEETAIKSPAVKLGKGEVPLTHDQQFRADSWEDFYDDDGVGQPSPPVLEEAPEASILPAMTIAPVIASTPEVTTTLSPAPVAVLEQTESEHPSPAAAVPASVITDLPISEAVTNTNSN